jgi:hypothetical protein
LLVFIIGKGGVIGFGHDENAPSGLILEFVPGRSSFDKASFASKIKESGEYRHLIKKWFGEAIALLQSGQ